MCIRDRCQQARYSGAGTGLCWHWRVSHCGRLRGRESVSSGVMVGAIAAVASACASPARTSASLPYLEVR
eukprot:11108983-Alexandrium_andersonii.AAC.1